MSICNQGAFKGVGHRWEKHEIPALIKGYDCPIVYLLLPVFVGV